MSHQPQPLAHFSVRLNLQTKDPANEAYFPQILIYRNRMIPRTQECLSGIIHIPMAFVIMCSVIKVTFAPYRFLATTRKNDIP